MDLTKFDIHIISYCQPIPNCADIFERLNCTVHHIPEMNREIIASGKALYHIFRQEHIEIVHVHMTFTSFHALVAAKLAGVKVRIAHAHLFNIVEGSRLKQFIRNHVYRQLTCALGTNYLACSEEAAADLFKNQLAETTIIRNGIDLPSYYFDPRKRQEVRKFFQLENRLALVHVGRFTHQKNHLFLLEVFGEVLKVMPEARLILVGTGELMPSIVEEVRQKEWQNQVQFLGNRQDVGKLLNGMDQFILPSIYEGGPIVAIEAQANGLPILAFDEALGEKVKLTPLMECLPFSSTPEEWATRIVDRSQASRSMQTYPIIEERYSIEHLAKNLETYYLRAVKLA